MSLIIQKNRFKYRYHFDDFDSPTFYNVAKYLEQKNWHRSIFKCFSHVSSKNFDFHTQAAETLEFKHLLAELVSPCSPEIMPKTYYIDENNYLSVLAQIFDNPSSMQPWILKPSLLNNGQYIKIFNKNDEILQYFLKSHRMGGEHILQEYIGDPHLLRGHKYSIRMFVIVTNFMGVYLYPKGYYNVATKPYNPIDYQDLSCHLTNEHLNDDFNNYMLLNNPFNTYDINDTNEAFLFQIQPNIIQIPSDRLDIFKTQFEQIQDIIHKTITLLTQKFPHAFTINSSSHASSLFKKKNNSKKLAIFGFDFMADTHNKIWLLEANHGPCFPTDENHPLHHYLYNEFWENFIEAFIEPIAEGTLSSRTRSSQNKIKPTGFLAITQ